MDASQKPPGGWEAGQIALTLLQTELRAGKPTVDVRKVLVQASEMYAADTTFIAKTRKVLEQKISRAYYEFHLKLRKLGLVKSTYIPKDEKRVISADDFEHWDNFRARYNRYELDDSETYLIVECDDEVHRVIAKELIKSEINRVVIAVDKWSRGSLPNAMESIQRAYVRLAATVRGIIQKIRSLEDWTYGLVDALVHSIEREARPDKPADPRIARLRNFKALPGGVSRLFAFSDKCSNGPGTCLGGYAWWDDIIGVVFQPDTFIDSSFRDQVSEGQAAFGYVREDLVIHELAHYLEQVVPGLGFHGIIYWTVLHDMYRRASAAGISFPVADRLMECRAYEKLTDQTEKYGFFTPLADLDWRFVAWMVKRWRSSAGSLSKEQWYGRDSNLKFNIDYEDVGDGQGPRYELLCQMYPWLCEALKKVGFWTMNPEDRPWR